MTRVQRTAATLRKALQRRRLQKMTRAMLVLEALPLLPPGDDGRILRGMAKDELIAYIMEREGAGQLIRCRLCCP